MLITKYTKLLSLILISFLLASCTSWSGVSEKQNSKKKIFAIHIHGDWCSTCKKIDPVIHSLEPYFKKQKGVTYLMFDETDPKRVAESAKLAAKHGLTDLFEHERHTGEVLFVDKDSKKILAKYYGVSDPEKYKTTISDLLAGKSVQSIIKEPLKYYLSKPPAEEIKKSLLYVVDIHHDMCGSCETTAPIFEEVARRYKRNKKVAFFTFDLSTPSTVDQTRTLAGELGISHIYNAQKHTGEVLFIDALKKQIVSSLVMETDKGKYHKLIKDLLKEIKRNKKRK